MMRLTRTRHWLLTALLILATACSAGPSGGASGPTPTPVPPAPEAEQLTYTIQRGTVSRSLEFTARVAPVQQAELFFRADSHLSRLLIQRDERLHQSDLLAEQAAQLREWHLQKAESALAGRGDRMG